MDFARLSSTQHWINPTLVRAAVCNIAKAGDIPPKPQSGSGNISIYSRLPCQEVLGANATYLPLAQSTQLNNIIVYNQTTFVPLLLLVILTQWG